LPHSRTADFAVKSKAPKVDYAAASTAWCRPTSVDHSVQKPYSRWIEILYGPFFKIIGFFYRVFTANRERVARLKANEKVSAFIRIMTILVLLGWILIWYFASDESRTSLVDEVKQSIGITDAPPAQ
jgi:hypothetical protein